MTAQGFCPSDDEMKEEVNALSPDDRAKLDALPSLSVTVTLTESEMDAIADAIDTAFKDKRDYLNCGGAKDYDSDDLENMADHFRALERVTRKLGQLQLADDLDGFAREIDGYAFEAE